MAQYIPQRGDLVTLTFDPQSGHEQKGRRPALVISHYLFNRHTGLAIVCPITTVERGYPFHVPVTGCANVTGFVMTEQVKSVDFRARRAKRIAQAPQLVLEDVLSILEACVF
jgi:mRNA interferase MazF